MPHTPAETTATVAPCRRCGARERYGSNGRCVPCARARGRERTHAATEEQREARREYARAWKAANPGSLRKAKLKSLYGISVADYERMYVEQQGVCAICRRAESAAGPHGEVRRLSVDHDHSTGAVRGLLCAACNLVLGMVERASDASPEYMRTIAEYLRRAGP